MKSAEDIRRLAVIRLVDDDKDLRKSVQFMLECRGWNVETYESADAFLRSDRPSRPGCLVLDVRMPGMSGLELQRELNARGFDLPVIFLTAHGDIDMAVQTMHSGAVDFLQKPVDPDRLSASLEKYARLSLLQSAPALFADSRFARRQIARLTEREREIVRLASLGLTTRRIAERLSLSEKTVENHRASACKKTGAGNVAEIIVLWRTAKEE